jgi:signal transduction histidine kinase
MIAVLWTVILLLTIALAALGAKVYLLRKGARQLRESLKERLTEETNTLLSLSTRDREMRRLASCLNQELRDLRRDRLRYQQGDRELKEGVANMSHDLRTPLTAICGYLELLKGQPLPPDTHRYLEQIENRTQAMKRLTEELFRYSVAASSQELDLRTVDLDRALEESLLSFYGTFESRCITPEVTLPQTKVERLLDPSALNRVLGNILGNALKYSAGDLAVTLDETGTISFSNLAPGLDQVAAGRLFDRFYTVEAARNSTGLGLSIAKLLTERMGGTIGAAYDGGRLIVTLSFPANSTPHT